MASRSSGVNCAVRASSPSRSVRSCPRTSVAAEAVGTSRTRRRSAVSRSRSRCPAASSRSTTSVMAAGVMPSRVLSSRGPSRPSEAATWLIADRSVGCIRIRRARAPDASASAAPRARSAQVSGSWTRRGVLSGGGIAMVRSYCFHMFRRSKDLGGDMTQELTAARGGERRRWFGLVAISVAVALIIVDSTIVNVAVPYIVDDLGLSSSQVQWVQESYTLVFAATLLIWGTVADRIGRRRMLLIGVVVFVVRTLRRTAAGQPTLFRFDLFGIRSFRNGNIAAMIVSLGEFGIVLSLPLWLQNVLGYTAFQTGVILLALAIGSFGASGLVAVLGRRLSAAAIVRVGIVAEIVGIAGLGLVIGPSTSWVAIVPCLFVYGFGVGLATAQLTGVVLVDVPVAEGGQASGTQSTSRQLGAALGIAILGTILFSTTAAVLDAKLDDRGLTADQRDQVVSAVVDS